jgi:hypothetical protein
MTKYFIALTLLAFTACNNSDEKPVQPVAETAEQKQSFFPVTAYLKGQIYDIKQKGLTPIKYTTVKEHTDSLMVKFEELETLAKEFLSPEIDSVNLIDFYTESKFLDQTIEAFTFTYEIKNTAPDSIQLLHWDVYIEPEKSKVKRIYMIKKAGPGKTLQLTWLSNKWFKTTTILNNADGSSSVEKEEKISWDY